MAVYTHLGAEQLADLIAAYDVGSLVSAKGIAEGVSNSNWLIDTTQARYILTMYERRIDTEELPFFLGLLDHLAANGCAVPATIHDRDGNAYRNIDGKAVALIEFLPGVSPTTPSPAQAKAVGEALAKVHIAGLSFDHARPNPLGPDASLSILKKLQDKALSSIDPELVAMREKARELANVWPHDLAQSVIHSDLFPDNVLMLGERVSGMIDFYFACTDAMAYDLGVTHAAWCFDKHGSTFNPAVSDALLRGYSCVRDLPDAERAALPRLAEGACLRFVASRAEDWIEAPADALVERKDPMDFVRRWRFYSENGRQVFA